MAHSRIGKGTYYRGRTKPLEKIKISKLARTLEEQRATFASPCGKKGEVYKIERIGVPGKYRYALLNDRIEKRTCAQVGKIRHDNGKLLMPKGHSVPLIDLSIGLAEYFGIRGKVGIGQFRMTLIPSHEHERIAFEEKLTPDVSKN